MAILNSQLRESEYLRTAWSVTPEAGVGLDLLLNPTYWMHVAKRLRPRDVIEASPEDASWYARLLVRSNGVAGPVLAVLEKHTFNESPSAETKAPASKDERDYEVKFAGSDKWRVLRKSTGEVLSKDHATRDAASTWLHDNVLGSMA